VASCVLWPFYPWGKNCWIGLDSSPELVCLSHSFDVCLTPELVFLQHNYCYTQGFCKKINVIFSVMNHYYVFSLLCPPWKIAFVICVFLKCNKYVLEHCVSKNMFKSCVSFCNCLLWGSWDQARTKV
jgi:hypothetical protein